MTGSSMPIRWSLGAFSQNTWYALHVRSHDAEICSGGPNAMNPLAAMSGRVLLVTPEGNEAYVDQCLADTVIGSSCVCCSRISSPVQALRSLRSGPLFDLVIIVPGAELRTYVSLCRSIKFDVRSTFLPVIFVLGPDAVDHCAEVLEAGADDCIQLPVSQNVIRLRLSKIMRAKQATDQLEDANVVITALAAAIEGRDVYTCGHVERVATYAVEISKGLGASAEELSTLRRGGVVHDIGKVAVPDHILNKPGKLTKEEMDAVRRHPVIGCDILRPLRTFRDIVPIVRWHHECPNGTGYPDGLKGDELPFLPRIVAVADCFDAMSTDRSYRPALSPLECRENLSRSAESGELDAQVVAALLKILDERAASLDGIHEVQETA